MRHYPRLDATQKAIVEALRGAGYSVYSLAAVGGGVPDIIAGGHGVTYLIEAKSRRGMSVKSGLPRANGAKELATLERQRKWREGWRGGPVVVVSSVEDALAAVGAQS